MNNERGVIVAVAFVALWVALLGHEAAHFAVGRITYGSWTVTLANYTPRAQLYAVAAGPLFTLAVLAGAAVIATRTVQPIVLLTLASLAIGSVSRLVAIAPGTLLRHTHTDEHTIGQLLGVSPRFIWTIEAVIAAFALWVVLAPIPRAMRTRTVLWISIGVAIGLVSGLTLGRAIGIPV